jgi:hypothetical protein
MSTETGTRTFVFTPEERRLLAQWASHEWQLADDRRMLSRPGSPQEAAAEADQALIEVVQQKLRGG